MSAIGRSLSINYKMKNKTLSFLFGLFSIWFLIWVFTPFLLQQSKTEVLQMIQDKELDSSALFYSDSEEAVEANFEMMKKKQEEKMQK